MYNDAICLTGSFVFRLSHCVNFKGIRYRSRRFNKIVAHKFALLNNVNKQSGTSDTDSQERQCTIKFSFPPPPLSPGSLSAYFQNLDVQIKFLFCQAEITK